MTWDFPALLPISEEGLLRIFIALKNPSPWPVFEPATFGSSDQHTNHYTTTPLHHQGDVKKNSRTRTLLVGNYSIHSYMLYS
jgi:hypothetical protein